MLFSLSSIPWVLLQLKRVLGERVLVAIERLMGMILTCVAVEMFIKGLKQVMQQQ